MRDVATWAKIRRARYRRGLAAEIGALFYLLCKGYWPVTWRYKTPGGEIDLVMRRGRQLLFVEVKARATHDEAAYAVHAKNQSRVVRAAQYFLAAHPTCADCAIRFDVVLIAWYRWPKHLVNAFQ